MSKEPSVFEEVLSGLNEGIAWVRGEKDLRVTRLEMPEPAPELPPERIRAIRKKSGMTQALFSRHLSISHKTLQAWEQGLRKPSPISSRFLQVVEIQPEILLVVPRSSRSKAAPKRSQKQKPA